MNRNIYFDYIEEKLHILAYRIETKGRLNLLDIHAHSEDFYLHFFNLLYNYDLKNLNTNIHNVEAIDLIDHKNKILIQVSANSKKQKIESALNKKIIKENNSYTFKFISISKDSSNLKKNNFVNPYSINFIPEKDIYDLTTILKVIKGKKAEDIKAIYRFIKDELGGEVDAVKFDSNLAAIINILSKEQWDEPTQTFDVNSFEIEKKITFNDLKNKAHTIKNYSLYYPRVDKKYSEFDSMGVNKSKSILDLINREYLKFKDKSDADSIFSSVFDGLIKKVLDSSNYEHIPIDELELCVDILIVDAFIRCKIFENPEGYKHVTP